MRQPRRGEAGSIAAPVLLVLCIAFIVLPAFFAVTSFPQWSQRQGDATDAARAAARALATADTWANGVTAGNQVVQEIAQNNGVNPADMTVAYSGSLTAGSTVSASVTVRIPATIIPGVSASGTTIHWTASSTQHVDDYRSFP